MLIVGIAAAWFIVGAVAVAVMRRRGHDAFSWAVLFLFLGPLALPLAVSSDRHRPAGPAVESHDGCFDVLVACDRSAGTEGALRVALRLFGARITSLTLAAVVDLEAPTTVRGLETLRDAQQHLDTLAREAQDMTAGPVETVILYGEPRRALQDFAARHGYELIVAGSHLAPGGRVGGRRATQRHPGVPSVPVLITPGR